ncbi:MAG: MBL fold metallo-hydrolase [Planctomycetota bacterium]
MHRSAPRQPTLFAQPAQTDADPATKASPDHPIRRSGPPASRICVLGSGSGGNSTVVATPSGNFLIDAGFGPRTTADRLAQARLTLHDISAVLLTHLDADHFRRSWLRALTDLGIPVFLHHWHVPDLLKLPQADRLLAAGLVRPFFDHQAFHPLTELAAHPIRLQHDQQGTIGFRLHLPCGLRLAYATDLGHAPPALIQHFAGADLLCLEANYDHGMTMNSSRPSFVNRRNLSDSGHLSNDQAFDAVTAIRDASAFNNPRRVVLLHRSEQCNHPTKLRRTFERDPSLLRRITLTHLRRRTRWISVKPLRPLQRAQLRLTA